MLAGKDDLLRVPETQKIIRCPKCGKENAGNAKYCGYCGSSMGGYPDNVLPVPASAYVPAPSNAGNPKKPLKRSKEAIVFIVLVVILILLGGGVIVAYNTLFPSVWAERLPYLNSSGQYQVVTVYRIATDVPYENLTAFLAAVNIEALVYADSYKPVEYAAMLHDLAEENKINCTVIGSRIDNGTPDNAVDAFATTDRGMVYVDPTGMNVSAVDYTVPFDSILLLRKQWTLEVPWLNTRGTRDNITVYRDAQPISYDSLVNFLYGDTTYNLTYTDPTFTCEDFAVQLFNDAEQKGIKCGEVYINYSDMSPGHIIDVFPTTDDGLVYVDDTGLNTTQQAEGELACPRIAYIQAGNSLGELPVNQTNGDLDYSFYQGRMAAIQSYLVSLRQYENDYGQYESDLQSYDNDYNNYESALSTYNAQMTSHNNAVDAYNSNFQQFEAAVTNYNENHVGNYSALLQWQSQLEQQYQQIPAAPTNGDSLDTWRNNLINTQNSLNTRVDDLDITRSSLLNSEAAKWTAFYPAGTIAYTKSYWG